jgi:hypothetical protein
LFAHASRIRKLSLNLPASHFHRFLQAPAGTFPVLEKLSLIVIAKSNTIYESSYGVSRREWFCDDSGFGGESDGGVLWQNFLAPITCFEDLPRLRSIKIHTCGYTNLDSHMLPLTWGNLTNINLEFVALSVFDIAYLLPQFTHAEYLGFATDGSMGFSMPAIPRVRLPQLAEINWVGLDMDGVYI